MSNLDFNIIYNENCLDTMSRMEDNSIDCVITSPPYDNLRDYHGYVFDFERIGSELFRIMKQGGVIVWIVGDATIKGSETGTSFKQALFFKELGFNLHDTMIYQKTGSPFIGIHRYTQLFEYMFVLSKGAPKTFNPIMRKNKCAGQLSNRAYRDKDGQIKELGDVMPIKEESVEGNVWLIVTGGGITKDKFAFSHPAMFPEELVSKHIRSWTNPGNVIYDPFMGSGTTAKVAWLMDRQFIGSEMSYDYFALANRRIKPLLSPNTTKSSLTHNCYVEVSK